MIDLDKKEKMLNERLDKIKQLEIEIKQRELAVKSKEVVKKQVLLRLSPGLWEKVSAWAEEDFRSINGQIEFLLNEAVKKHYKE